jgi:hypothetical protein
MDIPKRCPPPPVHLVTAQYTHTRRSGSHSGNYWEGSDASKLPYYFTQAEETNGDVWLQSVDTRTYRFGWMKLHPAPVSNIQVETGIKCLARVSVNKLPDMSSLTFTQNYKVKVSTDFDVVGAKVYLFLFSRGKVVRLS